MEEASEQETQTKSGRGSRDDEKSLEVRAPRAPRAADRYELAAPALGRALFSNLGKQCALQVQQGRCTIKATCNCQLALCGSLSPVAGSV